MLYEIVLKLHAGALLCALVLFLARELLLLAAVRGRSGLASLALRASSGADALVGIGVLAGIALLLLGGWALLTPWLLLSFALIATLIVVGRKLVLPWEERAHSAFGGAPDAAHVTAIVGDGPALFARLAMIALFMVVAVVMTTKPAFANEPAAPGLVENRPMDFTPLSRRSLLAASAALVAPQAFAAAALPFVADYESATGGRVGFFMVNASSGRQLAWRAHERFAVCSTFKASLAALVLARVDAGNDRLDRAVTYGPADILDYAPVAKKHLADGSMTLEALCEAAVELSDNTCANLLLREMGGPQQLTRFWRHLGDRASRLDHNEPVLNRTRPGNPHDTTTPAAMAHSLSRLAIGDALSPRSRERLVGWMVACQTGARKLRAGLPKEWRAGDKTGNNGADAAGDLAVAWTPGGGSIELIAYVQGGKPTPAQQDELFAALGQLAAERLG